MVINIVKALFIVFALNAFLNADEIDLLLSDIENKTDLSEQTKLENSGISLIYTRDDIDRMQAKYLKDILKSNATFGYNENKFGMTDPLTSGTDIPFSSSIMRVFIDNQEITGGMFGSGIVTHGNIDLGFVDHIEIYTQSPTYEYSTESTFMLIKLYSKSVLKDGGSKVAVNGGSFGALELNGYHATELNDKWSLFTYASFIKLNREKYKSHDTELSRDKDVLHLFTTFSTQNQNIMIDGLYSEAGAFGGTSMDMTPTDARCKLGSLHIGYDANIENFSFLATYDYLITQSHFEDDVEPITAFPFYGMYPIKRTDVLARATTVTAELKHTYRVSNNTLVSGVKHRQKRYDYDRYKINNRPLPERKNTKQYNTSLFLQNSYALKENLLLSGGVQYQHVYSKDAKYSEKENLFMYRAGLTYIKNNWIFKTVAAHSERMLEPYLIDSAFVVDKKLDNQESNFIYEDIVYKNGVSRYELIFGYMIEKNYLLPDASSQGKLNSAKSDIALSSALVRWEYNYNRYDKLFTEFSYQKVDNLPVDGIDSYKVYKGVLRSLNTYRQFDIFNEVIFDKNNIANKNFYDYSAGVIYNSSEDLKLSVKAENIFHKATEAFYVRVNPQTFTQEESLSISPYDRKITFSMEYLF